MGSLTAKETQDEIQRLNESGLFSQPITKEMLRESDRKAPLYQIKTHTEEELIRCGNRVFTEAAVIGGLPQHHSEAMTKRGWLLPFLLAYDELLWGRWDYWMDILHKGTIEGSGPIPQIEWCDDPTYLHAVRKMLRTCMDFVKNDGATAEDFADWLLWGLAATDTPPRISAKVNQHWYEKFDLHLLQRYPTDYMSGLLEEETSKGYKSAVGYFATPPSVTRLMTDLTLKGSDPEQMKHETVYEPTCGCGALLLPASNYNLFCAAQDINPVAVKFCLVQMYCYSPWFSINPFTNRD